MPLPAANKKNAQHRWAWIWLAYSGFVFIDPILNPSLRLWLITLGSLAAFLAIFAGLFYIAKTHTAHCWFIFAVFALGLVTFPFNQGASTYVVYSAAFLPFTLKSTRKVILLILLECTAIFAEGALFTAGYHPWGILIGWPNAFIGAALVLIIGGGNIYFAEQKRADSKLRSALEENVTLAAVAERERIARDLHDVLGHTLSVVVLKAELAGRLVSIDPGRAVSEMADVERTARAALAEIREAIGGYRSRGLAAEIEAARHTLDAAGVALLAEGCPSTDSLSPQEETALALALREAVTNIVRHANAGNCRLRFDDRPGLRRLVVEDDGPRPVISEGNGLRGMRQRIESVGGHFTLESGAASKDAEKHLCGTRLVLELPNRAVAAGKSLEFRANFGQCEDQTSQADSSLPTAPRREAAAS